MLNKRLIIITGNVASGKTRFLKELSKELSKRFTLRGFLSIGSPRDYKSEKASASYHLHDFKDGKEYLWATKKTDAIGFDFNDSIVSEQITKYLNQPIDEQQDVLMVDDMGLLELEGGGFASLLEKMYDHSFLATIVVMKKSFHKELITKFSLEPSLIIDLDEISLKQTRRKVYDCIYSYDSEKIALYSAICSGIEVGIGSTLHALKVPFKGHFLAMVQNLLLIHFTKELRGRNLFWIVLITSILKSFSPAGAKLKPMLFIFLQGSFFILPIHFFGVNILSVLIGSALLGLSTVGFSLLLDYILFGSVIIETYITVVQKLFISIGVNDLSILSMIGSVLVFKLLIALTISLSYFLNLSKYITKLKEKFIPHLSNVDSKRPFQGLTSWRRSFVNAVHDLFSLRFLIPFSFIALLIFFFADLGHREFVTILFRGIVLAGVGFLLARRINFEQIVRFLERHDLSYVARSLEKALLIILKNRKR